PAITLSLLGGVMAVFWTLLWLGVTLLAMYFVGATGLRCSVRAKNSWRSLLGTLGIGYVGGFILFAMMSPVISIFALVLFLSLLLMDRYLGTSVGANATGGGFLMFYLTFKIASCIGLVVIFWLTAKFFLRDTQKWIADRERTRHWEEEPEYYRPRK